MYNVLMSRMWTTHLLECMTLRTKGLCGARHKAHPGPIENRISIVCQLRQCHQLVVSLSRHVANT